MSSDERGWHERLGQAAGLEARVAELEARVGVLEKLVGAPGLGQMNHESDRGAVRRIQAEVAAGYGIELRELLGRSRVAGLVWPRHLAMYLCREVRHASWRRLGMLFRRDAGGVHHGWRRVKNATETDARARAEVEAWVAQVSRDAGSVGEGGRRA